LLAVNLLKGGRMRFLRLGKGRFMRSGLGGLPVGDFYRKAGEDGKGKEKL